MRRVVRQALATAISGTARIKAQYDVADLPLRLVRSGPSDLADAGLDSQVTTYELQVEIMVQGDEETIQDTLDDEVDAVVAAAPVGYVYESAEAPEYSVEHGDLRGSVVLTFSTIR